jgi:hypothetical protein
MNRFRFCTLLLVSLASAKLNHAEAQKLIEGYVLTAETNEPLPFVNIGILGSRYGTLSNDDGSFSLEIPSDMTSKSIIFSYIGYEPLSIPLTKFQGRSDVTVYLNENPNRLDPVIIQSKGLRNLSRKIGNSYSKSSTVITDSLYAGSEFALLIDVVDEETPYEVTRIQFLVVNNTLGSLKARPRFYKVNPKNGQPGKEFTQFNKIVESRITNGWVKVAFEKSVIIEEDFYISLEWIFDKTDRDYIYDRYNELRKNSPEKIQVRQTIVDGQRVKYEDFGGNLYLGWSIGSSLNPSVIRRNKAYIKYNSMGDWNISSAIPAIRVFLTTDIEVTEQAVSSSKTPQLFDQPLYKIIDVDLISKNNTDYKVKSLQKHYEITLSNSTTIDIQTRFNNNQLLINAYNKSEFYQTGYVALSEVYNLTPEVDTIKINLRPGFNNIGNFRISNPNTPYNYNLSAKSSAALSSTTSDSIGLLVKEFTSSRQLPERDKYHALKYFNTQGDTLFMPMNARIFNMVGTESPGYIGQQNTLGILDDQGRAFVFEGEFTLSKELKIGKEIENGQYLGKINSENILIYAYRVVENNQLTSLYINYKQ